MQRSNQRLIDLDNENCPTGRVPCSQTGLTICINEDSSTDLCPITDIKLVRRVDYAATSNTGYELASTIDGA